VADNKDDAGMEATEHVTTSESNSTDSANRAGSKSGKLTSKDSKKRVTDVDEFVNQKKARVSIVPKPRVLSAEKKKSNAKVTKPRRAKKSGATGDA
jgi:hypothetical protein